MLQKLPIGEQHFPGIREENKLYVDKTEQAWKIATSYKFNFLARPRRFGKSLMISTLESMFLAKRHLFEGLWIANHWDWEQVHPVIHISFNAIGEFDIGLEDAIMRALDKVAKSYKLDLEEDDISGRFLELIEKLAQKEKVVILIDEYDKPLVDYLDDLPRAKANRAMLKSFYSVLKNAGEHIRLLFITGVSKFSKVSIFSDLNNLFDLTTNPNFATVCGITQAELEQYFHPYIQLFAEKEGISFLSALDKIKEWYNGYGWNSPERLYNPFSLLNFFARMEYHNFWFSTGTPTFLVKKLNSGFHYHLEDVEIGSASYDSYDLESLNWQVLLFQTGYLTIKQRTDTGSFILGYPNQEVKESLQHFMLADYAQLLPTEAQPKIGKIRRAFLDNDLGQVFALLNSFFANIPAPLFIANRESYYHSIIHLVFSLLDIYLGSEVHTSGGRLDAAVETPDRIFIFEFKLDKTPASALSYLRKKDYAAPFRQKGKPLTGVGVRLGSTEKGVTGWKAGEA